MRITRILSRREGYSWDGRAPSSDTSSGSQPAISAMPSVLRHDVQGVCAFMDARIGVTGGVVTDTLPRDLATGANECPCPLKLIQGLWCWLSDGPGAQRDTGRPRIPSLVTRSATKTEDRR